MSLKLKSAVSCYQKLSLKPDNLKGLVKSVRYNTDYGLGIRVAKSGTGYKIASIKITGSSRSHQVNHFSSNHQKCIISDKDYDYFHKSILRQLYVQFGGPYKGGGGRGTPI